MYGGLDEVAERRHAGVLAFQGTPQRRAAALSRWGASGPAKYLRVLAVVPHAAQALVAVLVDDDLVLVPRLGRPPPQGLGWSYEQPLPDVVAIAALVAFWDERVDVFLDGERRERPGGAVAEALRDEFGV